MYLYFLGTGAGLPSKHRNVTAMVLQLLQESGAAWLFDCGEGTQHQVLRAPVKLNKINKIWITHLHGDHLFGLPGILSSRSFHGGTSPVTIYGPPGIASFLHAALQVTETHLSYPVHVTELAEGVVFEDEQFRVETKRLDHAIPSYGFRIVEQESPGELQVNRLRAEGIPPGPVYGQLKRGETVVLPDGRIVSGIDYLSAPRRGHIVTILGDTRKCDHAVSLAARADVLVHEATFASDRAELARTYYHSTAVDAAEVAREAQVKALILTHISARYDSQGTSQLLREAKRIFPATEVAEDFWRYDIK